MSFDILSKHGKLSNEEWREIKKHPEVGFRIAQATSELAPIAEYILCHHEKFRSFCMEEQEYLVDFQIDLSKILNLK